MADIFNKEIVWSKGDKCLCPYSEDGELYDGIITKLQRSNIGQVTAVVKFLGYEDDDCEEVRIELLQKKNKNLEKSADRSTGPSERRRQTSAMFSPLTGNEFERRLQEKYETFDTDDFDSKAKELSKNLFQTKMKGSAGHMLSKSKDLNSYETSFTSPSARKKCKLDITGGQALDCTKELRTSKPLSDLSSILDPKSVRQALSETDSQSEDNGETETRNRSTGNPSSVKSDIMRGDLKPKDEQLDKVPHQGSLKRQESGSDSDSASSRSGFSDGDLEKPKFNHKPEGAKVPFILTEDSETPVIQVPATVNQYLRDYQREGIKFMYSHYRQNRGAILGDDMGLGKTVQVIGLIAAILGKHGNRIDVMRQKPAFIRKLSETASIKQDAPSINPVLIIGPGCVLYNWLGELETWGYFNTRKFHGTDKMECLSEVQKGKVEIVVTTYETFREHQERLNTITWNAVFVDEVHKIKGLKAQTTKALRNITTLRRFGLTGTALQNNLLELWSILDWAQPGCLGRQVDFEDEFVQAIGKGQRHDANKRELALARKKKEKFANIRKGMMIRRTKSLISDQLPSKEENVVFCKLSELQTSLYKTILSHEDMDLVMRMDDPCYCESGKPQGKCCKQKTSEGTKISSLMFTFMHLLLKVSNHVALLIPSNIKSNWQAVNAKKICKAAFKQHPEFLTQTKEASFKTLSNPKYCGKMKILQGLLKVFLKEHSKVLVFSYSTQVLDIIEQYIMSTGYEYRRIDGTVSSKKRLLIVNEYNGDPNIFICLISTKAGGLGLNLTGANKVVIFDPNWNPSHDLQAQDRAYRIGQRRNVSVYRLVSTGTIEENMYLRQIYKQQLLNVSVEDENARRYFYAVQGSRQKKGELFGIKNMFALRTGSSCLTADIIKRNERVESALAGYEVTKYIPPVVRLQDDEDLEDVDTSDINTSTTESEQDYFAEFFGESGEIIDKTTKFKKEVQDPQGTEEKSPAVVAPSNIKKEPLNSLENGEIVISSKPRVRFVEKEDNKPKGKVKPQDSRTGKGKIKTSRQSNKKRASEDDEEELKFDQTLAGTFNDVTDVFENCGIVHIHENRKVVGGSKAEDHMTKCAISDVYELHQNSQDLAVQCEPLSESGEEDVEDIHESKVELQHNKVRSQVIGRTKILIGQTPKPFRMKHFEKLRQFAKSDSLLDFAEKVLTSTLEERMQLLKNYYENKDAVYKDIITLNSLSSRRKPNCKGKARTKPGRKRSHKKQSDKHAKGVSFMENTADLSVSESLKSISSEGYAQIATDDLSSLDIGNPDTSNIRKRKMGQNTTIKKKLRNGRRSTHIPELPSYLDTSVDDSYFGIENDVSSTKSVAHNQTKFSDVHEFDSSVLLSQMGKSSQLNANEIDSVDGIKITGTDCDIVPVNERSNINKRNVSNKFGRRTGKNNSKTNHASILDDLFTPSNEKSPKKPPPRKITNNATSSFVKPGSKRRKPSSFKEVDDIFSDSADTEQSMESENDVLLQTSTLKDEDFDCFDDPKLWKKKKSKPPDKVNIVDRLIADSDAEYNELFTSGKLKRKAANLGKNTPDDKIPSGNVGGSESLFSF